LGGPQRREFLSIQMLPKLLWLKYVDGGWRSKAGVLLLLAFETHIDTQVRHEGETIRSSRCPNLLKRSGNCTEGDQSSEGGQGCSERCYGIPIQVSTIRSEAACCPDDRKKDTDEEKTCSQRCNQECRQPHRQNYTSSPLGR
jgi:hypothetical protein